MNRIFLLFSFLLFVCCQTKPYIFETSQFKKMKQLCETSLVFAKPVSGSFTINTQQNLDEFLQMTCFYGDIFFEMPVKKVNLENLKMVFGSIYLQSSLLEEFSANHLEFVTGSLLVGSESKSLANLKIFNLPKLKEVRGHLQFENAAIDTINLNQLLGVGSLKVKNNPKLDNASFKRLERSRHFLIIEGNPAFKSLDLPTLRHVDEFIAISGNPLLKKCQFLREASGIIFKTAAPSFNQHPDVPPTPGCP